MGSGDVLSSASLFVVGKGIPKNAFGGMCCFEEGPAPAPHRGHDPRFLALSRGNRIGRQKPPGFDSPTGIREKAETRFSGIPRDANPHDATKQQFLELAAAFPDLKMIVQDQIAEGDKVVNRVLVRGTHKGEYMGIPGSGKTVEIGGIDILRMVNGKAAERWGYFDDVRLTQQLGAMPGSTK